MKNCLVAQSGGPTVAINASLAGVIQGAIDSKQFDKIYGSLNGVQGLLNGRLMDLSQKFEDTPMFIELLKKSPSMYLGSCRYQMSTIMIMANISCKMDCVTSMTLMPFSILVEMIQWIRWTSLAPMPKLLTGT